MGFGPRGLETALANRTARGGAGRSGAGRRRAAARALPALWPPLGAGSRAGTWAAQVLARPLLGSPGLAADVAPGPTWVLVRVPAVAMVAGTWEGKEGAMGRGRDAAAARPPEARLPGQALTRLGGRYRAALRVQPVETEEARCGRRLVSPVQVAVVPEAACEEEESPGQDTEWRAGEPGPTPAGRRCPHVENPVCLAGL